MAKVSIVKTIIERLIATVEAIVPDDASYEPRFIHDPGTSDEEGAVTFQGRRFWLGFPRKLEAERHMRPKERHPHDFALPLEMAVSYPYGIADLEEVAGFALDDATKLIHGIETGWASWNASGRPYVVQGVTVEHVSADTVEDVILVSQFTVTVHFNRDVSF